MQSTEKQSETTRGGAGRGFLAAALSLIVPGVGHLVIRRWGRAAIWFAGWILVAGASGSPHNVAVVALMVVAAVDAYVFAQSHAREATEQARARGGEA